MSVSAESVNSAEFSITRAVLYCCLVVFPFFILYVEMERFFAAETAGRRTEVFEQTEKQLLKFSEYAEDARFFHLLLQKSFAPGNADGIAANQVKKTSMSLKKQFPEAFTFMFWDKDGKLIASASDENRFSFLSRKLNVFLKAIRQETLAGLHAAEGFNVKFDKELRLLRQFLGPFVTPEELTKPFLGDSSAGCFLLHGRGDRVLGWYETYKEFSVLVFISEKVKGRLKGPEFLQNQLAGRFPGVDFLLFDEQEQCLFPRQPAELQGKVLINFGKFRQLVPAEQVESDGDYFNFQKLNQRWWAVAIVNRSCFADVTAATGRFMAMLLAAGVLVSFILYCYFLVNENPLYSVKSRLILIFAYIIFIPALVFFVVSLDSLKQKEKQTVTEKAVQAFQFITSIDNQFRGFLHGKAEKLNFTIDSLLKGYSGSRIDAVFLASAASYINNSFNPDTLIISDHTGADLLNSLYSKTIQDDFLRKTAAGELLAYLNCGIKNQYSPDEGIAQGFALNFEENYRKFVPFALSNITYISYLNTLRDQKSGRFVNLVQLFWLEKQMHYDYLKTVADSAGKTRHRKMFFAVPELRKEYPDTSNFPELHSFFEKVRLNGPSQQSLTGSDGRSYLAFGQGGTHLNSAIMTVIIDTDELLDEIRKLRKNLWMLAGLSLLMTLSLFHLLSYYLIVPINALAAGVEMFKGKNYSHRIDLPLENEFGSLAKSIDRSLENLQELEIAKTVQESLVPQGALEVGEFSVVARTSTMTSLGGDYYDFVVDAEKNLTVLMADVAGHGVQAALLMAMAKSVLLLDNASRIEPENLMAGLNRTFCNLRKAEISTMMTGQIIHISHEGQIQFLNAGHCPPLVVAENGLTSRLIENNSLPFGFSARRVFSGMPVELHPGETMILYSDGILECASRDNEILGPEGFRKIAVDSYHSDTAVFLENLFRAYESWATSQQDDITFVLIRHRK